MIFPLEIWEHIFLYSDPVTLTHLKPVCKCWNEIIDKLLKKNDHWYRKCKNDIPEYLWSTFCEKIKPSKFYTDLHEKQDAATWLAMYRLWMRCKNLIKYDTCSKCIEPLPKHRITEHITCMNISGNLLAIGTSEGYIYFYDTNDLNGSPIYVADHTEYVENVQFLRDDMNTIAVSCSHNAHVHFWDIQSKTLVDRKRGKLICTSYSYCYTALHNAIIIAGSVPQTIYEFGTDDIVAVGADNDKVLFYTQGGYYVQIDSGTNRNYSLKYIEPPNIRIRHYYIFKPALVVCITEYGYLGFLTQSEKWKIHTTLLSLDGIPTAVLVYGHLLILGLDSGDVHIYYVEDFETLDFNSINSKKLSLDTTAVVSLTTFVQGEEYLVVSYSRKIYIVKFI